MGKDTKKPSLFCVDPAGLVYKYSGTAIGKGMQGAKTEIEKLLANGSDSITCKDALVHVAKILHKVHDEKDKDFELEASWICPESNYEHSIVPEELLTEAEKQAKEILEKEEQDE